MNALLNAFDMGLIDRDRLDQQILEEIHRGKMLASEESVVIELTGRRDGTALVPISGGRAAKVLQL
jgi:hypothetical protein